MLSYIPAICADITNKYHDDWLVDIMLIIYYVIKGHAAKDLFQVWLDNRILTKEEFQKVTDNNNNNNSASGSANNGNNIATTTIANASGPSAANPNTTTNKYISAAATRAVFPSVQKKGLLSKLLENEKTGSLRINGGKDIRKRNNRFGGIYHIKETMKPLTDDDDDDDNNQQKDLDFITSSSYNNNNNNNNNNTATAVTNTTTTATTTAVDVNTSTESISPIASTDNKRPPLGTTTTTTTNTSSAGPAPLTKRIVYSYDNNPNAMRFPTAAAKRSKKNLLFAKVSYRLYVI